MPVLDELDISNMGNCILDVQTAMQLKQNPPTFDPYKKNYHQLLADLQQAASSLPKVYQDAIATPLINYLQKMGQGEFIHAFTARYPTGHQQFLQQIIPDMVLAVLLHHQGFERQASAAFQELVSDLYDSFLSEEDRVSKETGHPIKPPDLGVLPPLVKWGNPEDGPYTWPVDATRSLGGQAGVVNLPQYFSQRGLLAWSALGHETGGHDILHADTGLLQELAEKVSAAVGAKCGPVLGNLWASWIDEAASDVLGLLHLGPAAGIGLIGFFRAWSRDGKLRSTGNSNDPHPIDVLRGYLAAQVVKGLSFSAAQAWSQLIEKETAKDLEAHVYIIDAKTKHMQPIEASLAVQSARIAADVIAGSKLMSLEGHSLREIQDWTTSDQTIAESIGKALTGDGVLPLQYGGPAFYAAHVVSAAAIEALKQGANIQQIFGRMIQFLDEMNGQNPIWENNSSVTFFKSRGKVYHTVGAEKPVRG